MQPSNRRLMWISALIIRKISIRGWLGLDITTDGMHRYKPIITAAQHTTFLNTYNSKCAPALAKCSSSGSNSDCENADNVCYNDIEGPLSSTSANGGVAAYDFDVYDIRAPSKDPNPPETYASYLAQPSVTSAIGAKATYTECPEAPYDKFQTTGDGENYFT